MVKPIWIFAEARDSEWQWHQLGHMQVCTSLQTDNHASTPTTQFFTGRIPFLPPNQQRQSTEASSEHVVYMYSTSSGSVYTESWRTELHSAQVALVRDHHDARSLVTRLSVTT